jgi:hypothetical protein
MGAEVEIQRALFLKLSAAGLSVVDSGKQAADGGSATPFPYVEVGYIVSSEFDTAYETGFSFVARIHTRSRSASMLEAKTIQGQIYTALHWQALTITGAHFISIHREMSDCIREPDGSWHGVCEYRGLLENTPSPPPA